MTPFAPFADSDAAVGAVGGIALLLSAAVAAWVSLSRSRRDIAQAERIDALKEWQALHENDRLELAGLKVEIAEVRREATTARREMEGRFSRLLAHTMSLERMLQHDGRTFETWMDKDSKS